MIGVGGGGGARNPVAPCQILTCWGSINLRASPAREVSSHTHPPCKSVSVWFHARTVAQLDL